MARRETINRAGILRLINQLIKDAIGSLSGVASSRRVDTGTGLTRPPSISRRSPRTTPLKSAGRAMLAATALRRSPESITTCSWA